MSSPKLFLAQFDAHVGDIGGNTKRLHALLDEAGETDADLIIFPELTICGYPPEDLLLRPSMRLRIERAIDEIRVRVGEQAVILGYPLEKDGKRYNAAGVFRNSEKIAEYYKRILPNYRVFDEKRYFSEGQNLCTFEHRGVCYGLTICEDLWHEGPAKQTADAGAEILININASPYQKTKARERLDLLRTRTQECGIPIVYLNWVGGQDELVFDGGSFVMNSHSERTYQAPWFEESAAVVSLDNDAPVPKDLLPMMDTKESVYAALVLGVRDYVNKNWFKGVVLGLSGGIDSALTLAIAVDALGADRVEAVMMPYRYTSDMSRGDAAEQSKRMGNRYSVVDIAPMVEAFTQALAPQFEGLAVDNTEQNIQARCRGTLLMAISNKKGFLVLTTGNKSEMAVGYATLYGDMAGGFDVLKDVSKMLVYELAEYRNTLGEVIPRRVIERPPSAELAPDQIDEDNLPPYEVLDVILEKYIEEDMSAQAIIDEGFSREVVEKVVRLVDLNEYKRRQAAVGPRVTKRGFGRDRRYPITNGWKMGD